MLMALGVLVNSVQAQSVLDTLLAPVNITRMQDPIARITSEILIVLIIGGIALVVYSLVRYRGRTSVAAAKNLILAQMLVLLTFLLGLQFVLWRTGGNVFLAVSLAAAVCILAVVTGAGLLLYRYQGNQSLFLKEEYAPGEIVFRKGDTSDCAYFIVSGEAEVVREEQGKESILATLFPGDYFGEMSLLTNEPRNATVRAKGSLMAEVIGKENFLSMLRAVRSAREDVTRTVHQRLHRSIS